MQSMRRKISELKPHPKNEEIYGMGEDVSDLVEKIKKSGKVSTITITRNNVIIAGHRRRKACLILGIKEVNVEVVDFASPEDEVEWLVLDNSTREKTAEQKGREAKTLLEIEKVKAEERMKSGENQYSKSPVADSPHPSDKGRSRDITAHKVGFKSGREVARAIKAVDTIDELTKKGEIDNAELIRGVLNNRSVSMAEELARNIGNVEIPKEEKELIRTGMKSVNPYINKPKNKDSSKSKENSKSKSKICNGCGRELSIYNFYDGKNKCKNCLSDEDRIRKEKSRVFRDAAGNELKIDHEKMRGVDLNAIIESVKGDIKQNNEVNYEVEFELFKVNLDDYIFANSRYIRSNEMFNDMPKGIKEKYNEQILKLNNVVEQLKQNIKQ